MSERVAIKDIEVDKSLFLREGLDSDAVERYKQQYEDGKDLDPLVVQKETLRLLDGFHRYQALDKLERDYVKVQVVDTDNPLKEAARRNTEHGVPYSKEHRVKPYEFNRGELPILVRLMKKGDGITQKEILDDQPISKSTMSKTVNALVQKGYLRKEKNPEDRRATKIYLTEKGKRMEDTIKEIDENVEKIMLRNLSEGEREELAGYLKKLLKNLKK